MKQENGMQEIKKPKEKHYTHKKITSKQIVALIGVILLVLLYLATLAASILDSSASAQWFRASLAATIALPLLIWIYSWMYGRLTDRPTIGDPNMPKQCQEESNVSDRQD